MYTNYLISDDYLMHHGVKGMKWGVRHDPERSEQRSRNKEARSNLRSARKNYNKSYSRYKRYGQAHPISSLFKGSKTNKELNKRWDEYKKSSDSVKKARKAYYKTAGTKAGIVEDAKHISKEVGKAVAITAAVVAAEAYLKNPSFRRFVNNSMKSSAKYAAQNTKRGFNYMTKTRYNKAVQLASPASRYVNTSFKVNGGKWQGKGAAALNAKAAARKGVDAAKRATGINSVSVDTNAFRTDARMAGARVRSAGYKQRSDYTNKTATDLLKDMQSKKKKAYGRPKYMAEPNSKPYRRAKK